MFKYLVPFFTCLCGVLCDGTADRKPMYKYRYETEDFMKTAASSVPLHGYHVVEGGYYPEADYSEGRFPRFSQPYNYPSFGYNFGGPGGYSGPGGYPGAGGYSGGGGYSTGYSGGNLGGGYSAGYSGGYPGGYHHQSFYPHYQGGEYVDHSSYSGGDKHHNDASFEKASGVQQEGVKHAKDGYQSGHVDIGNTKGDSGSYHDEKGGKNVNEDGKSYHGGQHFNQEGKNADENKSKSGHKKGHVVKGFKTSHHKDESGKTEEYFDEANDEGGNYNYNGKSGGYGENGQSAYKGGHNNEHFNADQAKKQGHYDNHHATDNSNGDKGIYGENKYYGNNRGYGFNGGADQQSLLGHQENERFFKRVPYHVPFYNHY